MGNRRCAKRFSTCCERAMQTGNCAAFEVEALLAIYQEPCEFLPNASVIREALQYLYNNHPDQAETSLPLLPLHDSVEEEPSPSLPLSSLNGNVEEIIDRASAHDEEPNGSLLAAACPEPQRDETPRYAGVTLRHVHRPSIHEAEVDIANVEKCAFPDDFVDVESVSLSALASTADASDDDEVDVGASIASGQVD